MTDSESPASPADSRCAHDAPVDVLPAHWHRRVLTLAFPIILANLTQPVLGAVDTAVAGHLPDPSYLGGVAAGGLFFSVYSHARIWAAPLALCNYVVLGYLLGCQHVRLALLTQLFINGANIVAVLLYVYLFDWGIAGIGAATATADACGFVLGAALVWRLRPRGLPSIRWATLTDTHALKRLITLNRDIFIRTVCVLASFGWFAHAGARQGDVILAANAPRTRPRRHALTRGSTAAPSAPALLRACAQTS